MILQPSILLSTNNDAITIPEASTFKDKNDLASKNELNTTKTQVNTHINDFSTYKSYVEQQLQALTTKINNIKQETLQSIYKVGDVFISFDNKNPSEKFGGAWVLEKDRFLLGAGGSYGINNTGGEVTHYLTSNEIPAHDHWIAKGGGGNNKSYQYLGGGYNGMIAAYEGDWYSTYHLCAANGYNTQYTAKTAATGGNQPHNNMPPYIAVYIWRKTA